MIKRFTKVTSVLVVAASVVSMVPAMGAEIKKVDAEEGTVYKANANGNGIFYIDGEINGSDEAGYYVADNKYTKVDGINPGDEIGKTYKNRYLEFAGGDYYLDYTNGDVTDDSIGDNIIDDAATAVRKNIKKDNDGRFDENYYTSVINAEPKRAGETSTFIDGAFGNWSFYEYKLDSSRISGEQYSTIYADTDGKYVDADYNLGDLKVATTSDSVTIKNTEDTYEIEENGITYELKAEIKQNAALTEGYADMYRTADLVIYRKVKGANDSTYINVTDEVKFGGKNGHKATNLNNDGSVTVIERFSKEQASDDIHGIKYPKKSDIYFITDEDGVYQPLLGLGDASDVSGAGYGYGVFTTSARCITSAYVDLQNQKLYGESLTFKNKNGYNYVDSSDHDDADLENAGSWAIGGGDLFCLSDGYIKEWGGDESFEKIYKVDGAMNNIVTSDKDNIVVWNEDDEVYSVISNKASSVEGKNPTTTTGSAVTIGWLQNTDGTWSYNKADGTKYTGWLKDANGVWYYLKSDGVMSTGWVNDNGTWYYCDSSGAMMANTTIDGYALDNSGAWIQ